jgi:hypothetical protein
VILDESVYESSQYTKWWVSRISDEYMPKGFSKPTTINNIVTEKFVLTPEVSVLESATRTDRYTLRYTAPQDSVAHVNLAYFPGLEVLIDGHNHPFTIDSSGIKVSIPRGEHEVKILRRNTNIENAANYISLFCFAAIFGTMMRFKYAHGKKT